MRNAWQISDEAINTMLARHGISDAPAVARATEVRADALRRRL